MPGPAKKKSDGEPRRTLTVRLPLSCIERIRRVAKDASGYPLYTSMSGIVEAGIDVECTRIESILRAAYANADPAGTGMPSPLRTLGDRHIGPINNHCANTP